MTIARHNGLCKLSIDSRSGLSLMGKSIDTFCPVTMDCGRYVAIDIAGDNRLVIIEIDRQDRIQCIVNLVHRTPLSATMIP